MKICITLLILISGLVPHLRAQDAYTQGTEFWVGYFRNMTPANSLYYIAVANSANVPVQGRIVNERQDYEQTFTVPANSSINLSLDRSVVENLTSGSILNKGMRVETDGLVNVYAFHFDLDGSSDATIVLPYEALTDDYTIVTYTEPDFFTTSQMESAFMVVATEDSTQVEITASTPLSGSGGVGAGVPFIITLQRGQSIMYTSSGSTASQANDVTGTRVRVVGGCKNIAVFAGHTATTIGGCNFYDHLYTQLTGTVTWGQEYLLPVLEESPETRYRIYAPTAGTIVTIDGVQHSFPRPDGTSILDTNLINFIALNPSMTYWLEATEPVAVCMMGMGAACTGVNETDPFLVFLSSTDRMIATRTQTYVPADGIATARNYITVQVPTTQTGNVQLGGSTLSGWQEVLQSYPGGTPTGYSAISLDASVASQLLTSNGMLAYAYGYGVTPPTGGSAQNSFGYMLAGGFGLVPPIRLTVTDTIDATCYHSNDGSITASVSYGRAPYTFRIDTLTATGPQTLRTEVLNATGAATFQGLRAGNYRLRITDDVLCEKSVNLTLTQPDSIALGQPLQRCRTERTFDLPTPHPAGGTWSGSGVIPGSNQFSFDLLTLQGNNAASVWLHYHLNPLCTDSLLLTIMDDCEQLSIPNVFTPNGDGINDFWTPRMAQTRSYQLSVYSRYGQLVFQTNNTTDVWWGNLKDSSTEAPAGVYQYVIEGEFLSGIKFHRPGYLTLVR